ncbi:ATP-binding protein [Frankia sp. Cas4]|uniref:ATP-binding protein n=1 Tax=Frankia sp. Cas4 TaxID=3073927 RepID=UPI002AD483E0|nr:ATP-binding protein [Frankia sp. Cas4]
MAPGAPPRWRRRASPVDRLALPRHTATTAHLCAVYPFTIEAGLGSRGVFLGHNRLAGGGFFFDLHEAYDAGLIQGPNMVVSGAGAHGKSALIKAYLHRAAARTPAGGRPRFTAVIDPKGEWTALADRLGWAALRLRPGGGIRVNPLDAGPGQHPAADSPTQTTRRAAVTGALLAVALGQGELSVSQQRLVTAAVRRAAARTPTPTLLDIRAVLAHPDPTLAADLDTTPGELLDRRRPLLDACVTLVDHDLRGICDGPTSIGLAWDTTPGLVLDLSALLTNRRALKLVLTAAAGWLQAVMYGQPDRHKLTVIDEGWIALDDLAIVRFLQDQWRLGRQWGAANILITHAIADLRGQVHADRAEASIAAGLLNTTSVRVFLHQNPEQIGRLLTDMGLTSTEAALLDGFPPFTALWQVGGHTALVDHVIAADEWAFADTDTAMRTSIPGNTDTSGYRER